MCSTYFSFKGELDILEFVKGLNANLEKDNSFLVNSILKTQLNNCNIVNETEAIFYEKFSDTHISNIESGKTLSSLTLLYNLSQEFSIPLTNFLRE